MVKNARFLAFNGRSLVSILIRYFTRSKNYSHIAYETVDGKLIECWPSTKNPFNRWGFSSLDVHSPKTPYEIWEIEVTDEEHKDYEMYFRSVAAVKTRYDWLGVVGFVFKFVKENPKRLFCSEGCITPIAKSHGWEHVKPNHVSPQDFVELIEAHGGTKVEARETEQKTGNLGTSQA